MAVFIARSRVEAAIEKVEERTGREITVGSLGISLIDGLAIRDLTVTKPGGKEVQLHCDELQTDLGFLDLLTGNRRPGSLIIRGLTIEIDINRHGVPGLDDLLRPKRKKPDAKKKPQGTPLKLVLADSSVLINLKLPGFDAKRISVEGLHGRAKIGGAKNSSLKVKGEVQIDGARHALVVELESGGGGQVSAELATPIQLPLTTSGERFILSLSGFKRAYKRGVTTLMDVSVRTREGSVAARRIEAKDEGGSFFPHQRGLSKLTLRGVLAEAGKRRVELANAEITLGGSDPLARSDLGGSDPLAGSELWVRGIRAEDSARGVSVRAESARLHFGISPVKAWREGRPLDSVTSLKVVSPSVRIPTADRLFQHLPGKRLLNASTHVTATPRRQESTDAPLNGLALPTHVIDRLQKIAIELRDGELIALGNDGAPILNVNDVALSVGRHESEGLRIGVDARLVRRAAKTGSFSVRGTFSQDGALEVVTGFVKGKDIAHFVSGLSEYLSVDPNAEIDVEFAYTPPSKQRPIHRLRGKVKLADFGFQAWRVCHSPVTGLEAEGRFEAEYHPLKRRLNVQIRDAIVGQTHLEGSLDLSRPVDEKPRFKAKVSLKKQDCANVLASIPPVMIPRLKGMKVAGSMGLVASLSADLANPKSLRLKVNADMDACRVKSLGTSIRIKDLQGGTYTHHPVEPERGTLDHITVGPGTPSWVPSHMLPAFTKAAAVVTEDRSFYDHKGIRWDLISRALRLDVRKGRFVYGGSTITQQLVKNLYLTREKTLARKLEELLIAGQMERELTKDEILTLYINVIEFGPDIYGIKRAARTYFAKEPWHLSPLESAFIMGLKPYPKAGFAQWERQRLNSWWIKRVVHVMDMVRRREGAISRTEFEGASPYQPRFRKPNESSFSGRRYVKPQALPSGL